jgi:UDP-N-acetylglucosamine 2-epimerase
MQRQGNPFGDGAASLRIVTILKRRLSANKRTAAEAA